MVISAGPCYGNLIFFLDHHPPGLVIMIMTFYECTSFTNRNGLYVCK